MVENTVKQLVSAEGSVSADQRKQHDHFATDHLLPNLKRRFIRSSLTTLIAQGAKFALSFGSTIVLARLLTPTDYGLVGMAGVLTAFAALFSDLGLSAATIQNPTLNHQQASALFWISAGAGLFLTILVSALSSGVAWVYGRPELTNITIATSLTFVINGLGSQHQALLRRQMKFSILAALEICCSLGGVSVAITFALLGASYWALVAMPIATATTQTVGLWLASGWRPSRPRLTPGVGALLRFGGYLSGFNMVNYFARNADQFLIGWHWGAAQLGVYSRAYNLLLMPISQLNAPITSVIMPSLSRLVSEPAAFARFYLRTVNAVAWVSFPMVGLLVAVSNELFVVLLGDRWAEAGAVFKFLGPAAMVQPIFNGIGWVFISQGKTDRLFRWSLIACPIILAGFAAGLGFGVRGVAAGYAVALILGVLTWTFRYTFKGTLITTSALMKAIALPALGAGIVFIVAQAVVLVTATLMPSYRLLLSVTSALCIAGVVASTSTSIRQEWNLIFKTMRDAVDKRVPRKED